MTKYAAVLFFVLAFVLYIGRVYERNHGRVGDGSTLPNIAAPALPPVSTTPTATVPGVETPAVAAPTVPVPATPAPAPAATPDAGKK